jgi:hypothetical protein
MKNNLFVRIKSLTSVGIMAVRNLSGDKEEGLRNLVESVLDSDNECSDFSECERVYEVCSVGSDEEFSVLYSL